MPGIQINNAAKHKAMDVISGVNLFHAGSGAHRMHAWSGDDAVRPPPQNPAKRRSCLGQWAFEFWWKTRFSFDGATRTFEDIDKVYAALGLINALVIAIPASLTYTLGPDFWSRVKTRIATCSMSGTWSGDDYNTYFTKFLAQYGSTSLCSFCCLVMLTTHYLVKPNDFMSWWRMGRFLLAANVALTAASIAGALTSMNSIAAWFWATDEDACTWSVWPILFCSVGVLPALALVPVIVNLQTMVLPPELAPKTVEHDANGAGLVEVGAVEGKNPKAAMLVIDP